MSQKKSRPYKKRLFQFFGAPTVFLVNHPGSPAHGDCLERSIACAPLSTRCCSFYTRTAMKVPGIILVLSAAMLVGTNAFGRLVVKDGVEMFIPKGVPDEITREWVEVMIMPALGAGCTQTTLLANIFPPLLLLYLVHT